MSSEQHPDSEHPDEEGVRSTDEPDRAALVAELETLRAETERLRTSQARARRSRYRRTGASFAALGLLATAGGVLFPAMRTVLLTFGGTGLFAGLLTWFITPERFVSASVGDAVYEALARNHDRLCRELGLTDQRIYVPTGDSSIGTRLFIPQQSIFSIPDSADLDSLFVVTDEESTRGLSLRPTGAALFREFEHALDGPLAETPGEIVAQASEAVIEQFEIASELEAELDQASRRLSLRVINSTYGAPTRFDHPVISTVAVALARGLDQPIHVDLTRDDGDALATLRWQTTAEADEAAKANDAEIDSTATTGT